ncbi:hypothetical protein MRB53_024080 [Persea americana]|uniref:Uncharacterized protein n=1 Tax=Persea americana TaxID=3435 RepID=A0ACC2LBK4_PERAE|nr:hypothetical protein MRB53_024080 [Persea americana]
MATVVPSADKTTDLLQKLSIDSQTKTLEVPEPTKKKHGPVSSGDVANVPIASCERSTPPLLPDYMDPNMCYLPNGYASYYYGGYDGPINEWENYPRFVNPDGVEMPPPGIYGDNGSLMYHHGCGYPPYGAYPAAGSPGPTMGHDGQLYGPQHYHYATPYYQQPTTPNGTYTPVATPKGDFSTSVASEQVPVERGKGNSNGNGIVNGGVNGSNGLVPLKPSSQNGSIISNGSYGGRGAMPSGPVGVQDPRFGFDGVQSPIPWLDGPIFSDGQPRLVSSSPFSSNISNITSARNQNVRTVPHLMGLHPSQAASGGGTAPGFMSQAYPNSRMYGQYGNTVRTITGYGSNGFDSRTGGRGWSAADNKYKPRGRGYGSFGYGNENMEELIELNRGPRAGRFKNQRGFAPNITLAVKGQNLTSNGSKEESTVVPDRDQYNRSEFPVKYLDARFFIIKSYSEDDIHKSIKYNVWSSTPNGNKKLDAGYNEAQGKPGGCLVFLFFSVNTSGQFVGLAEMVGPVDFNKNVDYWQQDKWNGCFPVKWHIVKDVPNSLLKLIILENNDNKPVTNSRDTQEVKFEQGLEMLKIFKDHTSKTCILDDFGFYEARQKTMQEKKAKQQQYHKLVWDGKSTGVTGDNKDKDGSNNKTRLQKPSELASDLNKEGGQGVEDRKRYDNGLITVAGDTPNGAAKPASEKRVVANGVANGC